MRRILSTGAILLALVSALSVSGGCTDDPMLDSEADAAGPRAGDELGPGDVVINDFTDGGPGPTGPRTEDDPTPDPPIISNPFPPG